MTPYVVTVKSRLSMRVDKFCLVQQDDNKLANRKG